MPSGQSSTQPASRWRPIPRPNTRRMSGTQSGAMALASLPADCRRCVPSRQLRHPLWQCSWPGRSGERGTPPSPTEVLAGTFCRRKTERLQSWLGCGLGEHNLEHDLPRVMPLSCCSPAAAWRDRRVWFHDALMPCTVHSTVTPGAHGGVASAGEVRRRRATRHCAAARGSEQTDVAGPAGH